MRREKISGIYSITNKENGKRLIGQSKDIEIRWQCHRKRLRKGNHENPYFQNAWNKYGEDNFIFEFLYLCPESDLNNQEIRLIEELKTIDHRYGYNLKSGGDRPIFSDEIKRKIRDSHLGNKNPNYGKHPSKETLKIMSESKMGEKNPNYMVIMSDEQKNKISKANSGDKNYNFGKPRSEETKRKIGKSNEGKDLHGDKNPMFGKHHSQETKNKISSIHKGKVISEEQKTKLSIAMKGRSFSADHSLKISIALKGHKVSEETRNKIRETLKSKFNAPKPQLIFP